MSGRLTQVRTVGLSRANLPLIYDPTVPAYDNGAPTRAVAAVRQLPGSGDREIAPLHWGLVLCRQRPATASGVTFMTLEDETGFVNVVIWQPVFERYPVLVRTAAFIGITGKVQSEEGVVHLIADRLWQPRLPKQPTGPHSRDFR